MKVVHKAGKHWATFGTKLRMIALMLSKKKKDTYIITFDNSCKQDTGEFSKILGTSKGINPRKGSYRLAWRYRKDINKYEIRKMKENQDGIVWYKVGCFSSIGPIAVTFEKKYFWSINTPYFGGYCVPNQDLVYYVK